MTRRREFLSDHTTSGGQILPRLGHIVLTFLLILAFFGPFLG